MDFEKGVIGVDSFKNSDMITQGQTLTEVLNRVGKSTFVDFYYIFKFDDDPISKLPEEFTLKSRRSRTSKARSIFRDKLNLEALELIITSRRLTAEIVEKAKQIYQEECSN